MQGFQRAAELAPRRPDSAAVLAAWRPLAAAAAAVAGLAEQLGSTAEALQLERVDVALSAADARQHMLEAAEACWGGPSAGAACGRTVKQGPVALALAFAAFSDAQAAVVEQLATQQQHHAASEAGEEGEAAAAEDAATLLEGVQRLVLGYASTAVAVRDATSEQLFTASDGSNLLGWLSQAVQAADSISTVAAELQLLLPQLLALLYTPVAAAQVSAAVAASAEHLGAASDSDGEGTAAAAVGAEDQTAAAAMQPLLSAAAQHSALAALLQGLQAAQAAAQQLLPPEEQLSLAQEQLTLAGAVVTAWQELEEAAMTATAAEGGGDLPPDSDAWQPCSAALAAVVAALVEELLLPPLAAGLSTTAQRLREAAPSLARRSGLETAAGAVQPAGTAQTATAAAPPELVPFTDFEAELPGASMLLGGLEEELEPTGGGGRAGTELADAELADRQPGAQSQLVPFLDFDDSLAGAGGLTCRVVLGACAWAASQSGSAAC